jgi:methionyl-tRNA formyltransferase
MEAVKAKTLVIVNSGSPDFSRFLLKAVLRNENLNVATIIDSARIPKDRQRRFPTTTIVAERVMEMAKRVFNPGYHPKPDGTFFENIYFIARSGERDILQINDLNDPAFIEKAASFGADVVLLLGCPQILKKSFIEKFPFIVNFHDSLLPAYRGLEATSWSVYREETETGFTFHLVDENIDTGMVLHQQSIPLQKGDWNMQRILYEKCRLAAEFLERTDILALINKTASGVGSKPGGKDLVPSYFGNREFRSMVTIRHTADHSFSELEKRIKIFGHIFLPSLHGDKRITGIRFSTSGGIPVSDGYMVVTRVAFLPGKLAALIFRR